MGRFSAGSAAAAPAEDEASIRNEPAKPVRPGTLTGDMHARLGVRCRVEPESGPCVRNKRRRRAPEEHCCPRQPCLPSP